LDLLYHKVHVTPLEVRQKIHRGSNSVLKQLSRASRVNGVHSLPPHCSLSLCISYAELIYSCTAEFYPGKKPQKYVSATEILPFGTEEENTYKICYRAP